MKKEYDLKKMKLKRRGAVISPRGKVLKTIRLDADVLVWLNVEAEKRGIGYQTLLNMLLRERMTTEAGSLRHEIQELVRAELDRRAVG